MVGLLVTPFTCTIILALALEIDGMGRKRYMTILNMGLCLNLMESVIIHHDLSSLVTKHNPPITNIVLFF